MKVEDKSTVNSTRWQDRIERSRRMLIRHDLVKEARSVVRAVYIEPRMYNIISCNS